MKIKKVGNADSLSPHFYVELPAWERWTRTAGGMPLAGLSPSAIGTWAPAETVLFDEEGGRRIGDLLIGYLNTQTCPA